MKKVTKVTSVELSEESQGEIQEKTLWGITEDPSEEMSGEISGGIPEQITEKNLRKNLRKKCQKKLLDYIIQGESQLELHENFQKELLEDY